MMTWIVKNASWFGKVLAATLAIAVLCTVGVQFMPVARSLARGNGVVDGLQAPVRRVQHTFEQLQTLGQLMHWASRAEQRSEDAASVTRVNRSHASKPQVVRALPAA